MALPRGLRNNNPGNIRKNTIVYTGEKIPSTDTAFKQFNSIEYGYRAIFILLKVYRTKYGIKSISRIIDRYAPNIENNTKAYTNKVAQRTGFNPTAELPFSQEAMIPLVEAISFVENGIAGDIEKINAGWNLLE